MIRNLGKARVNNTNFAEISVALILSFISETAFFFSYTFSLDYLCFCVSFVLPVKKMTCSDQIQSKVSESCNVQT